MVQEYNLNGECEMFCDKCGNRLQEGSKFCDMCGNSVIATSTPSVQTVGTSAIQTKKKSGIWKVALIIFVAGIIIVGILIAVCIAILSERKPLTVDDVKNSRLNTYSGKTVGEAFESYFMFPEWKELQATETEFYVIFTGYQYSSYYGDVKTEIVFYNDTKYDESGNYTLMTAALTPEYSGSRIEISDNEIIDLMDAVYYGDTFSWMCGP